MTATEDLSPLIIQDTFRLVVHINDRGDGLSLGKYDLGYNDSIDGALQGALLELNIPADVLIIERESDELIGIGQREVVEGRLDEEEGEWIVYATVEEVDRNG